MPDIRLEPTPPRLDPPAATGHGPAPAGSDFQALLQGAGQPPAQAPADQPTSAKDPAPAGKDAPATATQGGKERPAAATAEGERPRQANAGEDADTGTEQVTDRDHPASGQDHPAHEPAKDDEPEIIAVAPLPTSPAVEAQPTVKAAVGSRPAIEATTAGAIGTPTTADPTATRPVPTPALTEAADAPATAGQATAAADAPLPAATGTAPASAQAALAVATAGGAASDEAPAAPGSAGRRTPAAGPLPAARPGLDAALREAVQQALPAQQAAQPSVDAGDEADQAALQTRLQQALTEPGAVRVDPAASAPRGDAGVLAAAGPAAPTHTGGASPAAAQPAVPTAPQTLDLRGGQWQPSLQQTVQWMARDQIQTAHIRVSPAELGPVQIHVSAQQDQLNIVLHAQHAVTRDTLEAALPRLRELLGGDFTQVNVNVGGGQGGQQEGAPAQPGAPFLAGGDGLDLGAEEAPLHSAVLSLPRNGAGRIDTFI